MPTPIQIAGVLERYMRSHNPRIYPEDIAKKVGKSTPTIRSFLKGEKSPHADTIEKIEDFLKNEGAMTRFGFEPVPEHVDPDPIDKEQLNGMGISTAMKTEEQHYVCGFLDDWQAAQVIGALMAAPIPEPEKKTLLGTLFAQDFPSLK